MKTQSSLWNNIERKILDLKNVLKNYDVNPEDAYDKKRKSVSEWIREWDFATADTKIYTHGIHQYPAMFIPQIVRKLILEYSNENETVLDIFNGSGSTMIESMLTNRKSVGIEINPLAVLIAKVKTTPIDTDRLIEAYKDILCHFEDINNYKIVKFANIDMWFTEKTKINLSKLIHSINTIDNQNLRNGFQVCFSDIIRCVSTCKHSGFKMHRDKKKIEIKWSSKDILDEFHKSVEGLVLGMAQLNKNIRKYHAPIIILGDSCEFHQEIGNNSADLIITSPPYGDSRTTVAYGQFSRLSSQWLGLIKETNRGIENIDASLLGGKTNGLNLKDNLLNKSITLRTSFNNYLWEIERTTDNTTRKKLIGRAKDVLSFYKDLDKAIEVSAKYLKNGKYFILVTGSRVVKNVKLNTDIIISELSEHYGFVLDGILFRKTIPKKRMPSKVSPSNIVGETAPTMTKESIVILRKGI